MNIQNWYIRKDESRFYICGEVYGNPRFKDGTLVITSHVVSPKEYYKLADGSVVMTRSGSTYLLGKRKPSNDD